MKPSLTLPSIGLILGLGALTISGSALAHSDHRDRDGDSINITITVDGKDHDVRIDEDGVEVDGKPLEDIEIEVVIDGDISEVADEILDEIEEALAEIDEAIEDVREEHDIED